MTEEMILRSHNFTWYTKILLSMTDADDIQEIKNVLSETLRKGRKYKKVLLIATSIFFLFCFFLFSVAVKKHVLTQFDFNMSVYVQDDIPVKLDKVFQFFSSLASVQGMSILLLIILFFRKKIIRGSLIFSLFLASHVVELFGKVYINHPPPPFMFYKHLDASTFNFNKYYVQTGNSFPSGHSFRTVFVAIIFTYTIWQIKRFNPFFKICLTFAAILLICIVGVSRVALGEHWTTDVIGGGLFGLATGLFSLILL
jgi:undecaprenyl-diphosphatase